MQCEQCGAEVDAKSLYCPQCGNRLIAAAANAGAAEPTAHDRFRQVVSSRQQNGDDPEQPLWEGSYSPKAMIGAWIGAGVVTLVALICGVMFLQDGLGWSILLGLIVVGWFALALTYLYRKFSVSYSLTTQRFIHQRGLLWRTTDRVELIDIDDITFTQGPIERMLDVGTIRVSSSDKTHPEFTMPGIDGVRDVAGIIDDERRKERRRRGLHIEAVKPKDYAFRRKVRPLAPDVIWVTSNKSTIEKLSSPRLTNIVRPPGVIHMNSGLLTGIFSPSARCRVNGLNGLAWCNVRT